MPATTPILDTFTRADENPLSGGGNWANLGSNYPAQLKILSNQCLANSGAGASGASYWTRAQYQDFECYVTDQSSTTLTQPQVIGRVQQPGGAFTFDGYMGAQTGGVPAMAYIQKYVDGIPTTLAQLELLSGQGPAAGDTILLRGAGSLLTLERGRSGGSWETLLSISDDSYTYGYLALLGDANMQCVNFGGGSYIGLGAAQPIPILGEGSC